MRQLKINFTDFWGGFNKEDNLFTAMLRPHYDIVLSDDPDILIYSCFGFEYVKYSCHRIFYAGENARPDFMECDFALSFDYESYGNKNVRLPLYRWRGDLETFIRPKNVEAILQEKKKFCCMLVSNPDGKERNLFFEKLSKYKKIDSGGKHLNNMGGLHVADKMQFISEYKFTMSFENATYPGYTTEKLVEPMAVNSIPIYWGNPMVGNDFNSKSFINIHDYKTVDEAIEAIIEIDNNDDLYKQYLAEPYFINNLFPEELNMEVLSDKLKTGIENILGKPAVATKITAKLYCAVNNARRKGFARIFSKPYWSY